MCTNLSHTTQMFSIFCMEHKDGIKNRLPSTKNLGYDILLS